MIGLLSQVRTATFVSGAVVGAVAMPILKSKTVRNATVTVLAKGYTLKQQVEEQWANIREEAEDIYAEAASKAEADEAKKASTGCDCGTSQCCQETGEATHEATTSSTETVTKGEDIQLDDISEDWRPF